MSDRQVWQRYWRTPGVVDYHQHDPLSTAIYRALTQIVGGPRDKAICEAGSGSGKISMWLARAGASVSLVDFAPEALKISRAAFADRGLKGQFIPADIRHLPLEDHSFDLTWNAGVLEHFQAPDQARTLREMARVTRPGGHLVVCSPHARCLPYRLGKYAAERSGRWPYGEETPLCTHAAAFAAAGLTVDGEFSIAQEVGFDFLRFIPNLGGPLRLLALEWWSGLDEAQRAELPGYLLVTSARVPARQPGEEGQGAS